ncbi:MAG: tetratricopeptide repeat protein [Planctomycetes bacterium]|nr:tetratricopeptide repeat protein [Planctomycetota bacterium]
MTSGTEKKPEKYQQALDWAEAGQYPEALGFIQSYLEGEPNDAEALNDAGTILWCQGLSKEALAYLEKAWHVAADSPAILWNLFEAYLAQGQGADAAQLFDDMERLGILQVDILNRAATVLIDSGELSVASATLNRSLAMEPGQTLLEPIVEVLRYKQSTCQEAAV